MQELRVDKVEVPTMQVFDDRAIVLRDEFGSSPILKLLISVTRYVLDERCFTLSIRNDSIKLVIGGGGVESLGLWLTTDRKHYSSRITPRIGYRCRVNRRRGRVMRLRKSLSW